MSVLFSLPEAQQTYVLAQWLQVADLHQLDSAAFGDRKFLRDFRNLVRSPTFVIPTYDFSEYRMSIIGWAIDRGLKFRSIELNSYTFEDEFVRAHFLRASGPSLEKIQVKMHADYEYNDYRGFDMRNQFSCIVKEVATLCPRLVEFSVLSQTPEGKQRETFTDDKWNCVVQLLQSCLCLKKLHLIRAHRLNKTVLAAISCASKLRELDLSNSTFDTSAVPTSTNSTVSILRYAGIQLAEGYRDGDEYVPLFGMFTNLHTISVTIHYGEDLHSLSEACPLLRHAHITVPYRVDDEEVLLFAQGLPQLRSLHLCSAGGESCSPLAAVLLAEHCPHLVHLNLCSEPRGDSSHVQDMSNDREGEHQLRELYVDSMTEHTLCTVLSLCPHLHSLGILHAEPYYEDIEEEEYSIRTVHTPHTRPAEQALYHINHTAVRALHLSNFSYLEDKHIDPLCSLEELHVTHVGSLLTHDSIVNLSRRIPLLKWLRVKFCARVDYKFILPVLQQCPELHTLQYESYNGHEGRDCSLSPASIMLAEMVKTFYPHVRCFEVDC